MNDNPTTDIKWKPILGLALLLIATVLNWTWVYGVLFIIWAANDASAGVTHFVEEVRRQSNPILFWTIIVVWVVLSAFYFIGPWRR